MKKIRVLVLSHMYPRKTAPISGIFIHQQMKALLKEGCQIKVISPVPYAPRIFWTNPRRKGYGQTPLFDLFEGIPVYHPRYICAPGKWFHGISCYTLYQGINKFVSSMMKKFQPHILHTHTATPDGYTGLILRRKYNISLVCSFRGSDINIYPKYDRLISHLTKKVISEADQIITVSNALKRVTETIAKPKKEIRVIYNGCDFKKFIFKSTSKSMVRKKLGISSGSKVLIFIGNLTKTKGIYELTEAFVRLSNQNSNLHLIIIGDGPGRLLLKKRLFQVGLQKKMHLMGKRPHSEIPHLLNASNIFVLPTHYEGLPNVVLEAMACSKSVVATRVGGIPEIVKNGKTGFLAKPKDVDSLVEAIDFLLSHPGEAKKIGERARKLVLENYTWEKSAEKTIKVYREVLAGT